MSLQLPQETTVTVGGQSYRLSTLNLNVLGEFLQWSKSQLPDPFDKFAERFGSLSESLQHKAFDRAAVIAERRGTMDDPETVALMSTVPGLKKLVGLLFKKHHPTLTDDQVTDILETGIREQGDGFLAGLFPDSEKGGRKPARKPK